MTPRWRTADGEPVMDRMDGSHLHGNVVRLLPEVFVKVNAAGRIFLVEEADLGRVVGETTCVRTDAHDVVVYAKRPGRFGLTRFVKNRRPEPCRSVVVVLKKREEDDGYILITAFIGHRSEPEPWDQRVTSQSRAFWANHALIWGSEPTVPGTETAKCPW